MISSQITSSKTADRSQSIKDFAAYIISPEALKKIRHHHHYKSKKIYLLVKNRFGKIAVHCIDKGYTERLRRIDVDEKFETVLQELAADLVRKIKTATDPNFSETSENNFLTSVTQAQFNLIINLIIKYEKVDFQIWQDAQLDEKKWATLEHDTYVLHRDKNEKYRLYYFVSASKVNIPLLDKTKQTSKILLTSLPKEVGIDNQGLKEFARILQQTKRKSLLHNVLKSYHIPAPHPNIYTQTKLVVQNVKFKLKGLLKRILDEKSYQAYLDQSKKDVKGRYVIPQPEHPANVMLTYQHSLNLLVNLEYFFESSAKGHDLIFQASTNLDLVLSSPWLLSVFSTWSEAYTELFAEIDTLDAINVMHRFTSAAGVQNELSKLIPVDKDSVIEKLQANPFYLSYKDDQDYWKNFISSSTSRFTALQKILSDLNSKLRKGNEAKVLIQKTIHEIDVVLAAVTTFNKSPKEMSNVVALVWVVYPRIKPLLRNMPKTMISLSAEFKDHFLLTAEQINLIVRDLIINLDQVEIHYHLKEGLLRSLTFAEVFEMANTATPAFSSFIKDMPKSFLAIGSVIKGNFFALWEHVASVLQGVLKKNNLNKISFDRNESLDSLLTGLNAILEEQGYQFKEEERYPFHRAMLASRQTLALTQEVSNPRLAERIDSLAAIIQLNNDKLQRENPQQYFKQVLITNYQTAIAQRMNELEVGKTSLLASPEMREIKIQLLRNLSEKIAITASLHDAIDLMVREDKVLARRIYLLWGGKTGVMLNTLDRENQLSNVNIVNAIKVEIDGLTSQRSAQGSWYNKVAKKTLEDNIVALQKFEKIVVKPGYLLNTALNDLNANHPHDYQVLITHQGKLLASLRVMEMHIPKPLKRKKLIDFLDDKIVKPVSSAAIKHRYGYALDKINQRISELSTEITAGTSTIQIKLNKIILLKQLHDNLTRHTSIDDAYAEIESDTRYKGLYYLLHEGRTGKMLSHIAYTLKDAGDKISYLDLQIVKLRQLRAKQANAWIKRHHYVEERLFALADLKSLLLENPTLAFENVFSLLKPLSHYILQAYDREMLTVLNEWQQAQNDLTEYRDNLPVELQEIKLDKQVVRLAPQVAQVASPEHKNENIYVGIIENLTTVKTFTQTAFSEMLDAKVYSQYFANAKKDAYGKFDLQVNVTEPYWVHYYKQFFNLLIISTDFIQQVSILHTALINHRPTSIWHMVNAYKELSMNLDELEIFPFLQRLTSQRDIKKMLYAMLPDNARFIKDKMSKYSIVQAMQKQSDDWVVVNRASWGDTLNTIEQALVAPDGEFQAGIVFDIATKRLMLAMLNVTKMLRKFSASSGRFKDYVGLIYHCIPQIWIIYKNYEQALASTQVLLKKQLMHMLRQINSILCDIMIGLDKFKLDSFLTDIGESELRAFKLNGMSIDGLFDKFNKIVGAMNFQFTLEQTYPYSARLQQSRLHFHYASNVPDDLRLRKYNNMKNLVQLQLAEKALALQSKAVESFKQKSDKVNGLLDKRISQLEIEAARWYNFTNVKKIKIELLKNLKMHMADKSFDVAFTQMKLQLDNHLKKHVDYLFEGRTGKVIKTIQHIHTTPAQVQVLLDNEIARITGETQSFFFFQSNKIRLVQSIDGLRQLKAILGEGGYRVNAAMTELCGLHPDLYKAVVSTQGKLLTDLYDIDQYIPDHEIGKITIRDASARSHRPF